MTKQLKLQSCLLDNTVIGAPSTLLFTLANRQFK
jgi:hypothetical protein